MPTYKVTDPITGKTLKLTGDAPPTEQELSEIFGSSPTTAEVKQAHQPSEMSQGKKFVKGAIETLPYAGALFGGALGAVGGPVTAAGGGGLGYLGGEYAKRGLLGMTGLEEQEPLTAKGVLTKDLPEAATVGMLGPVTDKAVPAIIKGTGNLSKAVVGKLTGVGKGGVEEAIKSGTSTGLRSNPLTSSTKFDEALRGKIDTEEIVGEFKTALNSVANKRSSTYQAQLQEISKSQSPIDVRPIQRKANDLLKRYVRHDANGVPDWERSTFGKEGNDKAQEIMELVKNWGSKQGDNTAAGLDMLKRNLSEFYSPSSSARQFVASLEKEVKDTIIKKVPQYKDMLSGYEKSINVQKEIEAALAGKRGGKITADLTLRKLTAAMRNDKEVAKDLLDVLGNQGMKDLSGMVGGYTMRSPVPLGLAGTGPALIGQGALIYFNPKFWPLLLASSPRASAEFLRMYGKVLAESSGLSKEAARTVTVGIMQELENNRRESR